MGREFPRKGKSVSLASKAILKTEIGHSLKFKYSKRANDDESQSDAVAGEDVASYTLRTK